MDLRNRVPITDEIREALKAKRLKLGYSFNKVAECLGIHWSTVRKWEMGDTTIYTRLMAQKVDAFLNDKTLTASVKTETAEHVLEKLMKRQRSLFRLISNKSKLCEKFLERLETLIDNTLEEYSRNTDQRTITDTDDVLGKSDVSINGGGR